MAAGRKRDPIRSVLAILAIFVLAGCASLTQDRHFGISKTSGGEVVIWFVDCYAPPWSVSVYMDEDRASGIPGWQVTQEGESSFPTRLTLGETPPGYKLANDSLEEPLEPDVPYVLSFSRGEAYGEQLIFEMDELGADVLTFDHQRMTPDEFSRQGCDGEG